MGKGRIRGWLFAASSVFLAAFSVVLYLILIKRRAAGALMYSLDLIWFVVGVALLSSFFVFFVLSSFPKKEEDSYDETDEYEDDAQTGEDYIDLSGDALSEYPELFLREGSEDEAPAETFSYRDAVQKALDSQRTTLEEFEDTAAVSKKADPLSELYGIEDSEGESDSFLSDNIYADLPDTLPEGYVSPIEDDDEAEEEEEEIYEEWEKHSYVKGIVLRVIFVVLLSAVSVLAAYLSSYSYSAYFEDRVEKNNVLFTLRYEWRDSVYYEIAPSFFGDSLSVSFTADDGSDVELMPSSLVVSEKFYEKYSSVYSYVADACEKMDAAGAKKLVKERKTIEGKFTYREDIGEYVEKLIEED